MIEKLDKNLAGNINSFNMSQNILVAYKAIEKINELVDAVNELQKHEEQHLDLLTELNEMRLHQNKAPADPYAEQRKWIGKLCKFWDNLDTNYSLAILEKIIEKEPMPFEDYRGNQWYHCEPVLPDDDIIYKGE